MPRSPRRRVPSCLRHPREIQGNAPVDALTPSQRLDRSNDGQDHTVSPYASCLASPKGPQDLSAVRLSRFVPCSRGSSRPARTSPPLTPPASTALQPAFVTTYDRPFAGLGWARDTPNQNFGKVEYFCGKGLTAIGVFCPSGSWRLENRTAASRDHNRAMAAAWLLRDRPGSCSARRRRAYCLFAWQRIFTADPVAGVRNDEFEQGGTKRSLPLRQRQEVQEVLPHLAKAGRAVIRIAPSRCAGPGCCRVAAGR
jgi:hypothetical protein